MELALLLLLLSGATLAYLRHCMGATKLGDILETLSKTCWFADIRISYDLSELPLCPSISLSQLWPGMSQCPSLEQSQAVP